MSKAFLPTILEQKEKEVAQMVMEDLQPLRQTYRLYDFLKSHQEHLQIIAEVKKASPSMGDINLDVDIVAQAKTYEDLGMDKVELSEITGGDAKENAEILLSVLKNEASPYLETTVLNAGLGFFANGKVGTIQEGVDLARQLIADGSALAKLQHLQEVQV